MGKIDWSIEPTSPNPRDDLLVVPFDMEDMVPDTRPLVGDFFGTEKFDCRTEPRRDQFKDWILVCVEGGKLVYGKKQLPSALLQQNPSETIWERRQHPWPTIIRGQPTFYPRINNGNLLNVDITKDEVPGKSYLTWIKTETWWTTIPWDRQNLMSIEMQPSLIDVHFATGQRLTKYCLHEKIYVPAVTGCTSIRGQAGNGNSPAWEYAATNFKTWSVMVISDNDPKIRGRYKRTRQTAYPPFDPLRNVPGAVQVSS